jgi:YjbE family integral membrane protein
VNLAFIGSIFSIIFINVILSGDNAVVIALASRRLRPRDRRRAIVTGGAGAVGLRVLFTALAALLLHVPLLQCVGGLLLVGVAYKLLGGDVGGVEVEAATSLWDAIQTIVVADCLMSLDNVLAVAGASHASFELLLFGLVTSMPIILVGSSFIARLMDRHGWLAVAGAVVLTVTAARMVADDRVVRAAVHGGQHLALLLGLSIAFSGIAVLPLAQQRHAEY